MLQKNTHTTCYLFTFQLNILSKCLAFSCFSMALYWYSLIFMEHWEASLSRLSLKGVSQLYMKAERRAKPLLKVMIIDVWENVPTVKIYPSIFSLFLLLMKLCSSISEPIMLCVRSSPAWHYTDLDKWVISGLLENFIVRLGGHSSDWTQSTAAWIEENRWRTLVHEDQ